ncbi:hypothetical protein Tco_0847313 [Tanacetum coccineum]
MPFPSRLKKHKKDDNDERLLSIFKQIHINLPFLEAMVHMPKGSKVLKDLLSHKEKLKKAASSIKLSEECSFVIQRSLPQKEGDPRILEMDEDEFVLIILGRPFLAIARDVIDIHKGKLSLRVEDETVTFNIGKSIKSRYSCNNYMYCVDHTAKIVRERWGDTVDHNEKWVEAEKEVDSNEARAASQGSGGPQGSHRLEYCRHKGIDSSFCTHKILMEDEFKPSVQPQRRANPNIKEVVKKEVIKLLATRLIYLILDSPWVSLQVVPRKGWIIVVKNEKNKLILQRTVTGWRVCIDYRKLNNTTRKDFPLPFIDQMIERLAGHEYYCFLDGFSGDFQIPTAPEDQEKTMFTCTYGTFAYKRMPFGLCNTPTTF